MLAELYELPCCPLGLVPESMLSQQSKRTSCFCTKNQPSQRKNSENRKQSQSWLNYAEVHPVWQGLKNSENRKSRFSENNY